MTFLSECQQVTCGILFLGRGRLIIFACCIYVSMFSRLFMWCVFQSAVITDLKPYTDYQIQLSAQNDMGESPSSRAILKTAEGSKFACFGQFLIVEVYTGPMIMVVSCTYVPVYCMFIS